MRLISQIEHTMERWTTTLWTLLLPTRHQRGEVVATLRRQCDDSAMILGHERVLVPNAFVIELPTESHRRLRNTGAELSRHLAAQVHRHAAEQGYTFAGPVAISLRPTGDDAVGRFQVQGRIAPQTTGRSPGRPAAEETLSFERTNMCVGRERNQRDAL
ncbi:FhaA domain-containing protein [Streptomyces sp. NPDC047197]|uniref:FhaA domain-containing protein n=1 Tax=unclassified Streptomyces TaxID=2593676 RepID=UPI0033C9EAEF